MRALANRGQIGGGRYKIKVEHNRSKICKEMRRLELGLRAKYKMQSTGKGTGPSVLSEGYERYRNILKVTIGIEKFQ